MPEVKIKDTSEAVVRVRVDGQWRFTVLVSTSNSREAARAAGLGEEEFMRLVHEGLTALSDELGNNPQAHDVPRRP